MSTNATLILVFVNKLLEEGEKLIAVEIRGILSIGKVLFVQFFFVPSTSHIVQII